MARFRVILNASTGEKVEQAFTPEEEAEADAAEAAALYQPLNRIQFKFMVRKLGLLDAIPEKIAELPESNETEVNFKLMAETLWEDGERFERSHPLFAVLGPALNLTSGQIDAAWLSAMSV